MEIQPIHGTGAEPSSLDLRTFTYKGLDKSSRSPNEVGESWEHTKYIENQHRVCICTSISLTMKARKHHDKPFSADFQYLLQKRIIDGNWREGSSARSACKVGHKFGFLPQSAWKHTTMADRSLSYSKYIKKYKAIPNSEIDRLLEISKEYKIEAYAKIRQHPDAIGAAINENGSLISRFVIGKEWYSINMNKNPEQPLQTPKEPTSGHLVNITKRHGYSYRIANSWGTKWARGGTAWGNFIDCQPTEMWQVWFSDIPQEIEDQIKSKEELMGTIIGLLQKVVELLQEKFKNK